MTAIVKQGIVMKAYPTLTGTLLILITFETIFTEFTDAGEVLLSIFFVIFPSDVVTSGFLPGLVLEPYNVVGCSLPLQIVLVLRDSIS